MSSADTTVETVRRYAFYVAVVVAIAVPVLLTGEMLLWVATGWSGFLAAHSVHDLAIFAAVWAGLSGLLVQFYRGADRVNAIVAMPLVMIPAAAIGFAAGTELAVMGAIFGAASLLALALHPAGRSLLRFDRVASPSRISVGLFAVGAVAMVAYGAIELLKQFTIADDHAIVQHYGNLALAAFYVALMAGLAVFRRRDWRFAAWSAGFVALYIGASSAVFPAAASSLGVPGGVLLAAWAVVFVATAERVRGSPVEELDVVEGSAVRPS